jgi:very-short-patch-repair endonuclease
MENHNNFYNKKSKLFARDLRNNSTTSEIILWTELLRAKKMMGYSFRRQRPIGIFVADFMCKELGLIIEADGISHEGREEYDKFRDKALLEMGFTTLRFSDDVIINDLDYVDDVIRSWIKNKISSLY